jgi:hypothetical protein
MWRRCARAGGHTTRACAKTGRAQRFSLPLCFLLLLVASVRIMLSCAFAHIDRTDVTRTLLARLVARALARHGFLQFLTARSA